MSDAEKVLHQQIEQYLEMLHVTQALQEAVHRMDTKKIIPLAETILVMHEKMEAMDRDLSTLLEKNQHLRVLPVFQQRTALIREIMQLTENLKFKCREIMAINRSELSKIGKGRILTTGYHSNMQNKGRLIKISK